MNTRHKTLEELKSDLDTIKSHLKTGGSIKKHLKKEIKRQENTPVHHQPLKRGLDGIVNIKQNSIPVTPTGTKNTSGLDRKKLDILDPKDPGISVEKIKGLKDILQD